MVEPLADVVEKAAAACQLAVEAEFVGHEAGEPAHLERVRKQVLAVGGAELEAAHGAQGVAREAGEAEFEAGLLAGVAHDPVHLVGGLLDYLFDAAGVDAAVCQHALDGPLGDLAADGVEGADDDGLGGVVDDEVDARGRLDGPDVAAFAADDAALELLVGEVDDGDAALGHKLACKPLHGDREHLLGPLVGLFDGRLLNLAGRLGSLGAGRLRHALDDPGAGLFGRDAGDFGQLLVGLAFALGERLGPVVEEGLLAAHRLLLLGEVVLLLVEGDGPLVEFGLALGHLLFELVELLALAAALALCLALRLDAGLFGVELGPLFDGVGLELGGCLELLCGGAALCFGLGAHGFAVCDGLFASKPVGENACDYSAREGGEDGCHGWTLGGGRSGLADKEAELRRQMGHRDIMPHYGQCRENLPTVAQTDAKCGETDMGQKFVVETAAAAQPVAVAGESEAWDEEGVELAERDGAVAGWLGDAEGAGEGGEGAGLEECHAVAVDGGEAPAPAGQEPEERGDGLELATGGDMEGDGLQACEQGQEVAGGCLAIGGGGGPRLPSAGSELGAERGLVGSGVGPRALSHRRGPRRGGRWRGRPRRGWRRVRRHGRSAL